MVMICVKDQDIGECLKGRLDGELDHMENMYTIYNSAIVLPFIFLKFHCPTKA